LSPDVNKKNVDRGKTGGAAAFEGPTGVDRKKTYGKGQKYTPEQGNPKSGRSGDPTQGPPPTNQKNSERYGPKKSRHKKVW